MYFLYTDESGSLRASQSHFIFAGITVFEKQTHWLSSQLEKITTTAFDKYGLGAEELHGSPMWTGSHKWHDVPKETRRNAIKESLRLIDGKHCRIIASVVNKNVIAPEDPVRFTFQQVISRFDCFLKGQFRHCYNHQCGLLICDESNDMEHALQAMTTESQTKGQLRNVAEVPVFVDSKATRLIQLADLVAYALFRKYERDDNSLHQVIEDKFDSFGGVRNGLHVQI